MDMTTVRIKCLTRAEVWAFLRLLRNPPCRLVDDKPQPIAPFRRERRILSAANPIVTGSPGDWLITVDVALDPTRYRLWDQPVVRN
jgi:hypothetical protein